MNNIVVYMIRVGVKLLYNAKIYYEQYLIIKIIYTPFEYHTFIIFYL